MRPSPGSGTGTTTGNPWRSVSDCATATVQSLDCNSIDLQIQGSGISNQTITMEPTATGGASKWDRHGDIADSTDFMGTKNATALKFRTNDVERLRITEDGKVGIGVSNPLEKFELAGNLKLSSDIIFSDYADVNDTIGKLLMVDKDGRTHPAAIEQIVDGIYDDEIGKVSCVEAAPFQNPTWANGTNKIFSRCPQVKVGIGTDTPEKLLDVRGTTQTEILEVGRDYSPYSLISGFRTGVTSQPLLTLGQYDSQAQVENKVLAVSSAGEFNLNYNSSLQGATEKIFTISDENRKLVYLKASNETLYARRIVVDQQTWADYVFQDNYPLMSLRDLKTFVYENKHLPGIPSENKIANEGLDLAQMNELLLKKNRRTYTLPD